MSTVSEHYVHSYHLFSSPFSDGLRTTLADLTDKVSPPSTATPRDLDRLKSRFAENWIPDRLQVALKDRYADDAVWKPVNRPNGSDFYLPIHQLVSGELPARCKTYALSDQATRLLAKGRLYIKGTPPEEQLGHRLAMILSGAAEKRLADLLTAGHSLPSGLHAYSAKETNSTPARHFIIPIRIEDALLYHFSTGRIVCQLTIAADLPADVPMTTEFLSEISDQAGRFARLGWVEVPPTANKKAAPAIEQTILDIKGFSLGSLVARLIYGPMARSQHSYRTFTHVFARFSGTDPVHSKTELEDLGVKLARQYNSDYAVSFNGGAAECVSDFENVVHLTTLEGAASLVDCRHNEKELPFLSNYYTQAVRQTYLPLIVLNLHQLSQALNINTRSVLETTDPEDIEALETFEPDTMKDYSALLRSWTSLQDKLAVLNTRFRFRFVSRISMHNRFNTAVRKSFNLDRIEEQLSTDVTEMASRVQTAILLKNQARRQKFERRFQWIPYIATGFAAGFFILELYSAVSGFQKDGFDAIELAFVCLSAVLVIAGALWAYYQDKHSLPPEQT